MTVIRYASGTAALDDEGYLTDLHDWNEELAYELARREGVEPLSDEMLAVIRFMRSYHEKFHAFPILDSVCHNIHQPHGCVNEEFIDPVKAWRIAGLPEPGEEVLAYLKRE